MSDDTSITAKEINRPMEDLRAILNEVLIPLEKKENFKKNLEKFESNIKYSLEQADNKVSLSWTDLPKDVDEKVLSENSDIVKQLDKNAEDWCNAIDKATASLKAQKSGIKSASMEIDSWRRQVSNLSNLHQQLNSEAIGRIKEILFLAEDSTKKSIFKSKENQFEKEYDEAADYLKFLITLERSIKELSNDDLSAIEHSIVGIFHNLKIIYMISKHKEQNKYGFLMEVMSKEICDKISEKIKLREIFKNPDASIALITQAMQVANKWKLTYTETKNKTKWDYNSQNITGGAEYIIKICQKLIAALKKVKEYLKFLGPDLKRVIGGSSERIDEERDKVVKAYSFIENYENSGFKIFNKTNEDSCNKCLASFDGEMIDLKNDTIELIDETFRSLRSAESAYDLFTNFESLIQQQEIQDAMKQKYNKILEQFNKEVNQYTDIFEQNEKNPPISKAKSSVAGKIAWARLLFLKMRRPLSKIFTNMKNDTSNPNAEILKNNFFNIAHKLKSYENEIFESWKKECEDKFMKYLRNYILVKVSRDAKENPPPTKGPKGAKAAQKDRSKDRDRYEVQFDPNLKLMIRNTKFLDLYGFEIPKNIINIAHQEGQLARYCNMLNLMLKEYDLLMSTLNEQHLDLLKNDIIKLVNKIEVGTNSHNWTSLGIEEFIKECLEEIKQLKDKANSVFKSEEKIKNILKQIGNANLVRELDLSSKN